MRPLVLILIAALALQAQAPRLLEVQERRLANGARLLVVERRGLGAFHAALVFRGGQAEEPAALAGATDLLARALYGETWPEDLEPSRTQALEPLLAQEEGLLESLRAEHLRLRHDPTSRGQLPELEASLASTQARLAALCSTAPLAGLYASRGGREGAEPTADALVAWTELPQEAFEVWCRTEAARLRTLQLSRFSAARAALVATLRATPAQALALLRGAALPGHPYGRALVDNLPALEAMRRSDLRKYARRALGPGRLTIILVGGLSLEQAAPLVEKHFGTLPVPPDGEEALLPEIPADLGDRRLQASLGGDSRLLTGWRIPPRSHPDHLPLRMAAQLLGGGSTGRLASRLAAGKAVARETALGMDLPGSHLPGLLVVDLKPADGHSLAELESALHGEILRLQQEPIGAEEWSRALAQLELGDLRTLDEPAALAQALGRAWAEGGDWRLLDLEMQRLRTLTPEAVQAAARAWLKPSHRTTARLEPSTADELNPLEAQTAKVLNALAATRIQDPAQREQLVAEGLRQLRMLSPDERLRTLKLLEAQLAPEKR
jgi:zinc protease